MATKFAMLLKEHGFSQTSLSDLTGVSQSNISIYCNYQHHLEKSTVLTRIRLSKAFSMTLEQFEKVLELKPSKKLATNKQEFTEKELLEVMKNDNN